MGRRNFVGQPHQPHGFAVALRFGHAEIALQLLLGVAALLMADDHHGPAVEEGHAGDDGGVVAKSAVAVNF